MVVNADHSAPTSDYQSTPTRDETKVNRPKSVGVKPVVINLPIRSA